MPSANVAYMTHQYANPTIKNKTFYYAYTSETAYTTDIHSLDNKQPVLHPDEGTTASESDFEKSLDEVAAALQEEINKVGAEEILLKPRKK